MDEEQLIEVALYIEQLKKNDPNFAEKFERNLHDRVQTAVGRPSKLVGAIVPFMSAIRRGMGYRASAKAAGISYQTFLDWRTRGQAELDRLQNDPKATPLRTEVPYVDFVLQLEQAEGQGEFVNADVLQKAAIGGQKIQEMRRIQVMVDGQVVKEVMQQTEKELPPDPRSAQFILERRREGWQRKISAEITGRDGGPITHFGLDLSKLGEEELDNLIANLQATISTSTDDEGDEETD